MCLLICVLKELACEPHSVRTQSHTGYICLTSYHCAYLNVSTKHLHERTHSHTDCIYLTFLQYVFSNVSSNGPFRNMHSCIGCIALSSSHYVSSNVTSNCVHNLIQSYIGYICGTFLQCVCFQVCHQGEGLRAFIVTLVEFI